MNFGKTDTVEYLDTAKWTVTVYFGAIVDALVKKYNLVRGIRSFGFLQIILKNFFFNF